MKNKRSLLEPHLFFSRLRTVELLIKQLENDLKSTSTIIPTDVKEDALIVCQIVKNYNRIFKEIFSEYDIHGEIKKHGEFKPPSVQ